MFSDHGCSRNEPAVSQIVTEASAFVSVHGADLLSMRVTDLGWILTYSDNSLNLRYQFCRVKHSPLNVNVLQSKSHLNTTALSIKCIQVLHLKFCRKMCPVRNQLCPTSCQVIRYTTTVIAVKYNSPVQVLPS